MGVYPSAAKLTYELGGNSTFIILVTTFTRMIVLLACCRITGQSILKRTSNKKHILAGGILQAISIIAILTSVAYIPAPVALTILFTYTLMLLALSVATGEETFTWASLFSSVSALIGVTLVIGLWGSTIDLNLVGIGLAFIAALASMGRAYVFGNQVKSEHPMVVGAWTFIIAAPLTLLLIPFTAPVVPPTLPGLDAAALAAVALGLGTIGTFYGIALLGAFQFSLFLKLEPVFTALFSIVILGEFLSLGQYMGMAIVIISLVGYQIYLGLKKPSPST